MLQTHSNKQATDLNHAAISGQALDLSPLTVAFDLAGQLSIENAQGQLLNLDQTLQQLKAQGQLATMIANVWVPSSLVLLTQVFVPGKRKADWMAALPYSLEESLSEPVEDFHFVAYDRDSAGVTSVAIVAHQNMKAWTALLDEVGLSHVNLLPDCFRVPWLESDASGVTKKQYQIQNSEQWLVRSSAFSGYAVNEAWLGALQNQQVETEVVQLQPNELLSSQLNSNQTLSGLNLKTKPYLQASMVWQHWSLWRWPALLLVLLLVSSLASSWMATQKLAEQTAYTKAETTKLFQTLFPDVKRIIDIKIQTKTHLDQQGSGQQSGLSPMQVLRVIEPIMKKVPEVTLKNLTWSSNKKNARLILTVEAKQTNHLQKLISLSQQAKLAVNMKLELKNVSPNLVEALIHVDAK